MTKVRGVTLVELLVTLTVLTIIVAFAVPAAQDWLREARLDTGARALVATFQEARSEAVGRQQGVTLATVEGGLDWGGDVELYTDADTSGNTAFDAGEDTLILTMPAVGEGLRVTGDISAEDYISFRANGMLNEGGNTVSISLCDTERRSPGHNIEINRAGRVRLTEGDCDSAT